jgi:hypothetical protein
MTTNKSANAAITNHEEQEKVNYLSMRFLDILELIFKENKRVIDITCPLEDKDVIITISIKELNEKGVLDTRADELTLMTFLDCLNELDAREMDVTTPRWNGEVVVATIKLSIKEKTVA